MKKTNRQTIVHMTQHRKPKNKHQKKKKKIHNEHLYVKYMILLTCIFVVDDAFQQFAVESIR